MSKQAELTNAILRHTTFVQRLGGGQGKKLYDALDRIKNRVIAQLSGQELSSYSKSQLKNIELEIRTIMQTITAQQTNSMTKHMKQLAKYELQFSKKLVKDVLQYEKSFSVPTLATIETALLDSSLPVSIGKRKQKLNTFMKAYFKGYEKQVIQTVRDGTVIGRTNEEIVTDISRVMRNKQSQNASMVIARTLTNYTANTTRNRFYKANSDIVKKVKWLSTLDDATCPECGFLDQQIFDFDKLPQQPHHYQCRCTALPLLENDLNEASGIKVERATKVGDKITQVDGRTSFRGWFDSQSEAFKREHLGTTRYQLYKSGTPYNKFIDDNYRLIDIDKLAGLDDKFIR